MLWAWLERRDEYWWLKHVVACSCVTEHFELKLRSGRLLMGTASTLGVRVDNTLGQKRHWGYQYD